MKVVDHYIWFDRTVQLYRIHINGVDSTTGYKSVPEARRILIRQYAQEDGIYLPPEVSGTFYQFDPSNEIHAALAHIENIDHPHNSIIAVGHSYYLSRRASSRWAVEFAVRFNIRNALSVGAEKKRCVSARNHTEFI